VFEDERCFSQAFFEGGFEKEQEERDKWVQREREEHLRRHHRFRERFMNEGGRGFLDNFNYSEKENQQNNTSKVGSLLDSSFENNSDLESYYTDGSSKRNKTNSEKTESFHESKEESASEIENSFDELD
jgi:hypothetical protein